MRGTVWMAAGVTLVLVLAGCLEAPATETAKEGGGARNIGGPRPSVPSTEFVAHLPDGTLVDASLLLNVPPLKGVQRFIGSRTFEPTLAITSKGSIFMVAFGGGARIFASHDQGATWAETTAKLPTGQNNPPNSNDPFVIVDRTTDRVFTSDLQALICSWLNYSDDNGKTWTTNPIGCGHPFGVHDHQSIWTGKPRATPTVGYPSMVYYCVNRVGDSSCAASNNGGLSFGPLVTVLPGIDVETAGFCGGLTGHVKTDHAGRVFWGKSQCGRPMVGISEDDGRTWKTVTVSRTAGIRGHDVEIAADEANNVYAFWRAGNDLMHVAISRDHGQTWSKPIQVTPPGVAATSFPAIAAGAEGKIAFAYIGTNISRAGGNFQGAVWHGYMGVMVDALAENPVVLTTMVDSAEDPIARNDCTTGNNGRCNGMGDFINIQIAPDGRPWAAFVDVCNEACRTSGNNDVNQGFAGTLATGPALNKEGGPLPPLPEVPAKSS